MDDIVIATNKLLRICSPNEVEIEARIRRQLINKYTVKGLIDNIGVQWDITQYSEKRKISKHNRKCTYRQRNQHTICKSSIIKADINDIWCTVHVSIETNVPYMLSTLNLVTPILVTRYRTVINDHYIDIIYSDQDDIRVEVEVCNSQDFVPSALLNVVEYVCTLLQGNNILLSSGMTKFVKYYDWKMMVHVANAVFGPFCIEKKQYQKPSTLTINVLLNIADNMDKWAVTPKVDGIRKFLICANGKVFSIGMIKDVAYEGESQLLDITIIDCESVNQTFYIFDVPVYKGVYCGNNNFDERMVTVEEVHNILSPSIQTQIKEYKKFDSFDKLCKLYETFENNYTMDGIIFANINRGYMQQVAKWKIHSTVDLEIRENNTIFTCDGYMFDIECTDLPDNSDGIWELAYYEPYNFNEQGKFVAKRQRYDKPQANSKRIAFKNIYNSVPGTLFTGHGFYLMRKYHNMIKKHLIKNANDAGAIIMDIGTGQGGDVRKWSRASKVYCIEPDADSIREMHQRWGDMLGGKENMHVNITIIASRLADIDIQQIDKKIDIFTAFFCMNQWLDDDWKMLEKAINTKGSKKCRLLVIAMTDPREHKSENLEIKIFGPRLENYNIKIHGTRIMNINEKAVSASYITKLASKCGLKLVKQERLNYDFMTKDERRLSAMYTSLVYHK